MNNFSLAFTEAMEFAHGEKALELSRLRGGAVKGDLFAETASLDLVPEPQDSAVTSELPRAL